MLLTSPFIPMIEYLGGMEPTHKSLATLILLSFKHDPPRYGMLVWTIPMVIGLTRLANMAFKAHVVLAAIAGAIGVTEFLFAAHDTTSVTVARLQVYTGLEGVAPPHHYGIHAALVAGTSLIWMFDELYARRELKSADGI